MYKISNDIKHKTCIFRICVFNFIKNRKTKLKIDKFLQLLIDMIKTIVNFNSRTSRFDQRMFFQQFCQLIRCISMQVGVDEQFKIERIISSNYKLAQ